VGDLAHGVGGAYLLTSQVSVSSGFWGWFGPHTFGLTLLPLVVGIGLLFFDGRSRLGWLLTAAGAVIIFLGILMNLRIYFEPTSLYNTVLRFVDNRSATASCFIGAAERSLFIGPLGLTASPQASIPGELPAQGNAVHRPARAGPAETRTRMTMNGHGTVNGKAAQLMLVLLTGGLGLVARSLKPYA
jgi:hypothetical protein